MPPAEPGLLTRLLRFVGRFLLRIPWPLSLVLVGSWCFLIWDLSSHRMPIPEHPSKLWELISNLAHAPLFGTLTLWLAALLLRRRDSDWPRVLDARYAGVLLGVVGYGVLDEWHQSHVPGRDSSVFDILTDLVSATMVLWIVHTLGQAELAPARLRARLALGMFLCVLAATLATLT